MKDIKINSNKMPKCSFMLIIFFSSLFCAGCLNQHLNSGTSNTSINTTTDFLLISRSNMEMKNNLTGETNKALVIIKEFSGSEDDSLRYEGSLKGSPNRYVFSGKSGTFIFNNATGRVEDAFFRQPSEVDISITPEKAQALAELYGKSKYPSFWLESWNRSIKLENNVTEPYFQGPVYTFKWRDWYLIPLNESSEFVDIRGMNTVHVTISPSGNVLRYSETYVQQDPTLNLIPDISESHAWDIAEKYFEQRGITNISRSERKTMGLWSWNDSWNDIPWPKYGKQYLVWVFDVNHKQNFSRGGQIMVDAHDGHIVNLNEIV